MRVTLDGQNLFDEQQLEIEPGSISRATIERAVAGLDGVLSIDMGSRGRKIKQKGLLQAKSRMQMSNRINAISAYMDGNTHTLARSDGDKLNNLRMDYFKVSKERAGGIGIVVDYEITYTQLA
ncbi:MAG: hypothetical protein H8D56_21720 [Planctomycetes bacterium]|nr:hypothetical protein [Planctomycetota bacterium]MBL7143222.1 hypothetical protein [Phycisphaerae bacterium]